MRVIHRFQRQTNRAGSTGQDRRHHPGSCRSTSRIGPAKLGCEERNAREQAQTSPRGAAVKLTMAVRFNVADGSHGVHADLEGFFDRVLEELLRLDAVEDSTISASLARKTVTIMVTIDAPSPEGAAAIGMSAIRAAFHAAGAATPDWPLFDELSIGAGELIGA